MEKYANDDDEDDDDDDDDDGLCFKRYSVANDVVAVNGADVIVLFLSLLLLLMLP